MVTIADCLDTGFRRTWLSISRVNGIIIAPLDLYITTGWDRIRGTVLPAVTH